ncbi:MAG: acylphosphatase [Desulfatibacillaceae bacterium]|nr:acylphosphatase [Desulfatibacillaceae bacterium]
MEPKRRVHAIISGRVQGVFFRASTQKKALSLGLNGWVKNLPNGSVEAVFEGPDELVEKMIEWAHSGPPSAKVASVQVKEVPADEALSGFAVRY